MKHMVSYTLKPDRVDENERLIAAVFAVLSEVRPACATPASAATTA